MLFSFRPTSVSRCFASVIFESKMGVVVCSIGGIVGACDVEFYKVYFYSNKTDHQLAHGQGGEWYGGHVVAVWQVYDAIL